MNKVELSSVNRMKLLKDIAGREITAVTPHGISILVNEHVFIPTSETFELIDLAREVIKENSQINSVADIGTGTGVIAISLAQIFPNKSFFGLDISKEALKLAKTNSKLNNIDNVTFIQNKKKQWVNYHLPQDLGFIVSNPPYIGDEEYSNPNYVEMYPEIAYEPAGAIRTYDRFGLDPFIKIIEQSKTYKTKFYLFQCNEDFIDPLVDKIDRKEFNIEMIKDKKLKNRFLLLLRK